MNPEQPQQNVNPAPVSPPTAPVSPTPAAPTSYPGKGLGIASFVVSLVGAGLIGLILGIVGLRQSKKAGHGNGFAIAGIIIGIVNILVVAGFIAFGIVAGNAIKDNTTCMSMQNADGTTTQHCSLNGTDSQSTTTE